VCDGGTCDDPIERIPVSARLRWLPITAVREHRATRPQRELPECRRSAGATAIPSMVLDDDVGANAEGEKAAPVFGQMLSLQSADPFEQRTRFFILRGHLKLSRKLPGDGRTTQDGRHTCPNVTTRPEFGHFWPPGERRACQAVSTSWARLAGLARVLD